MLCDLCKNNIATVHITKIVNGNKQQLNLCEHCANEVDSFGMGGEINLISPFSFQNILSGLMDYMNGAPKADKMSELVCKNCGTTFSEFKDKGLLGCSECYENFSSAVNPVINRVQGKLEHVGKIPKKCGSVILEKKRILTLKEELQKAIAGEEYEKAAQIRDKIREIQGD